MNVELKPCPFCGGEAEMMGDQYPYVECQECAAGFTANHSYEFDEDDAASKWNARSAAGTNLKPIAESKVRQLGGDVCGVLVRKDEKLAAVDEHGRVQWLQGDSEHTAYLEGMNAHLKAELKAARAQGGQGAEVEPDAYLLLWPDGSPWGAVNSQSTVEMWMKRADEGRTVKPLYTQPQPAVPECPYPCGWDNLFKIIVENAANFARSTLDDEIPESVRQMGIDSGQYAIHLCKLAMNLSTHTTPQADGWVRCEDRLPKHGQRVRSKGKDGREFTTDYFCDDRQKPTFKLVGKVWDHDNVVEWMPQPPAGQEGE